MKYPIENGIPLPADAPPYVEPIRPYAELQIGQSFIEPDPANNACGRTADYSKQLGRTFVARQVDGGIRIWRTA